MYFLNFIAILLFSFPALASGFSQKSVAGVRIADSAAIERFYTEREGDLLFIKGEKFSRDALAILKRMESSWGHGLNPANYHVMALQQLAQNGIPDNRAVESEILFADAVIRYGQDISGMRLPPKMVGADARSWSRGIDAYALLTLLRDESNPAAFLDKLLPNDDEYRALSDALITLSKDIAQNPDTDKRRVAFKGVLKVGQSHPAIVTIRQKLGDTGTSPLYDEELKKKVQDFQRRHGLSPDGIIGLRSFDAINQTRTQKLVKLIANLERRRWVRRPVPSKRLEVNIPAMRVRAIEDNRVAFDMPVIVGREKRPTVSFVDDIVGIRFNPKWYVPDTIKKEDFLPALQKNPNALDKKGIKFRVNDGTGYKTVAPSAIDWATMTEDNLKSIQMFQDSGEDNALGVIRVLMPNQYDIYLHDTNAPELFAKDDRALSSGCIRLSEPRKMAQFILKENDHWDASMIDTIIATQKLKEIATQSPIPVYLFYYTAWIDKDHGVIITNDVYGDDVRLVAALQAAGKIPFDLPKIR